ncbi:MAG: NAD(P)(+) transhydrogenase (Re/Si-specific) subunit beta, partial [Actinomycetota bacterium]|nr:NAD(P)(+) transhydrogenase (Re/Si-specific) subunit beta [Actinomycetota bacterium]
MSRLDVVAAAYLVAAILFVLGLKSLARPRTAPRGNLLGASGMLVAVVATLLDRAIVDYSVLLGGLVIGSAVGVVLALRVRMTAMPQLVALFNGFG